MSKRYMAYDGEGIEVGQLTLSEAREQYDSAEIDSESGTITVERGPKAEALRAVEEAAWDENNSALAGSDIWGVHGSFAAPRAASFFSYEQAVAEVRRAFE